MKKILIISPHFPPSNLAAVHRARLFANHLPSFGWEPIILTVDEKYYEERLDPNLTKLLPSNLRVEKVTAMPVSKPRIIGDIGLRAFFSLYNKAKAIIKDQKIHFLYIPIPSFYVALLGRWLHASTGVPFGIDYIDPWVHPFPNGNKLFSRHWMSERLAKLLEPVALKNASVITGVAEGYYEGVKQRNPKLVNKTIFGAMPYGGEKADFDEVKQLGLKPYLFKANPCKLQLVYGGAMLPKAYEPLKRIFAAIKKSPALFEDLEIHFIGTGKTPDDASGYNIRPVAEQYGLWQKTIFEYPARISYLDVLVHLNAADGIFILGSTEAHYTPSKVYQGVLSEKAIFAILHSRSTAVQVLERSKAGIVLHFAGEEELNKIEDEFLNSYKTFKQFQASFDPAEVNHEEFEQYSAKECTRSLVRLLDSVIDIPKNMQPYSYSMKESESVA